MTMADQFLWAGLFMVGLMAVLWVIQWLRQDATLVDVGWAAGLGATALWFAATSSGSTARAWLVGALAALWALRLAWHLFAHRAWGKPEDGRYQTLRRLWGPRAHYYFFLFFEFQAGLVLLFALPFWGAMAAPEPWRFWDVLGIAIWATAVLGETLADRQLASFRAHPDNRGQVCRQGLWRYSRHPNYFFEWLHWWTYVALGVGSPYWWLTWLGPALMLLFLLYVTGIPATESQVLASRGEAYRDYQRTTSAFIPWFPKDEIRKTKSETK
jgi:steroid 5-alpha reductase family enzyme